MAKKRKKKKGGGGSGTAAGVVGGAVGGVLLNMVAQLVTDGLENYLKSQDGKKKGKKAAEAPEASDVSTKILISLCQHGPRSIPELLEDTKVGLGRLLRALQTVREFHLVEMIGEDDRVQLTMTGSRTLTVISKNDIRDEAHKLLEA